MVKKKRHRRTNKQLKFYGDATSTSAPNKGRRDLVSNRHFYKKIKISFTDVNFIY